MVVQCCVCKKVRDGLEWKSSSLRVLVEEVSHGYCPECASQAFEAIRRYRIANATEQHSLSLHSM
jgi:hypothetical protein